jgi:predicted small lipoprotein YifL
MEIMRHRILVASCAAVTLLCGCGQKGPLVLPDAQKHKPNSSAPAATAQPAEAPASAASRPLPAASPTP